MVKLPRTLVAFSKDLRTRQTFWEAVLWEHLRAGNFGFKFKRQIVIGPYIFDFGAKRKKLLIEVNGYGHRDSSKDQQKLGYAEKKGFRVLKFWNSEVERNLRKVLEKIQEALK